MKGRDILAVLFFVLTVYSFAGGTLLGLGGQLKTGQLGSLQNRPTVRPGT